MTVSELISQWTEEERAQLADLIAECLEREKNLRLLHERMKRQQKEFGKNLDLLISRLAHLSRGVQACNTYLQEVYLKVAKPKGSA
jgi:hypothetical protein